MKNYKVGDEVLVKGKIDEIDIEDKECTYRIDFVDSNDFNDIFWIRNDSIIDVDKGKSYEDGLKDAFGICMDFLNMTNAQRQNVFGVETSACLYKEGMKDPLKILNTYNDIVIRPGDVVYINAGEQNLRNKFVILAIDDETIHGYSYCDDVYRVQNLTACAGGIIKTGEHVDLSYLTNGGVKENG